MGNRFGRNQKRRMREEIARRDSQIFDLAKGLVTSTSEGLAVRRKFENLKEQVEMWDAEIRHLLGNFSSFRPGTQDYRGPKHLSQIPITPPLGPVTEFGTPSDSLSFNVERVLQLAVDGGSNWEGHRFLRVRIVDADYTEHDLRYAMSRSQFNAVKLGPRERRYVAERIAQELCDGINSGRGDRRLQEKARG